MRKWALGLALLAASVAPAFAAAGDPSDVDVRVNGVVYNGGFAFIGDRVYVNVDAFSRALDLPHHHNALNWQLKDGGKGNPYVLSVDAGTVKLPTVRFRGITMVDVERSCAALKVPFHHDFATRTFEIGSPWSQEYVIGSYARKVAHHNGSYQGSTRAIQYEEDNSSWAKHHWNSDYHHDNTPHSEQHEH